MKNRIEFINTQFSEMLHTLLIHRFQDINKHSMESGVFFLFFFLRCHK